MLDLREGIPSPVDGRRHAGWRSAPICFDFNGSHRCEPEGGPLGGRPRTPSGLDRSGRATEDFFDIGV